ncbi:MAG TPA: PilZ domain-containing protein [Micavibrio sp.]|jgi:alginate biosynthesis protein Alg44
MTQAVTSQIVHESETQRQHIRLPIPAKVVIKGREYDVCDLSPAGVGITGIVGDYTRGQMIPIVLRLPFGTFSMDVNVNAEIQHYNGEQKLLGGAFVNLTTDQLALLNHILKAFLAGDVVASGDLLNVASRDSLVKARKQTKSNGGAAPSFDIKRQIPGLAVMGILGLVAAYIIGGNMYESAFVLKSTDAYVSVALVNIDAPVSGSYKSLIAPGTALIENGQAIAEISGPGGAMPITINSPCNCVISSMPGHDGDYVNRGAPLIALSPADSKPVVIATVEPVDAGRIRSDGKTKITIAGTQKDFSGHVTGMKSGLSQAGAVPQFGNVVNPVIVTITPDQPLPADLANIPARVIFTSR